MNILVMIKEQHTIDAKGKKLGRVASEAAHILMGKNTPDFTRNNVKDVVVSITNATEIQFDEKKQKQKQYVHYTGYPGGKREEVLSHLLDRKGVTEVLKRAVYGMLPANRLRKKRLSNLTVEE